jgi:hypothetical protein
MNVLWQVPQFVLIGASEVLSSVASLEFFYSQAGPRNRGLVQSLNLLTTALGSFIIIPLVLAVNSKPGAEWLPQNIDRGHLDWFFLVLAGVMGASLVVFIYAAKGYKYVDGETESGRQRRRIDTADDADDTGDQRADDDRRVRVSEVELIVAPPLNPNQSQDQSQGQDRSQSQSQGQDQDQDEAANPMLGPHYVHTTGEAVFEHTL